MSTYCAIKSKLSDNVIDVQEASTKPGAPLDAYPPKTTGNDNQLWEFVSDPSGSGYFFIKSKLSGNVIDVREASTKSGALLDAYPQKASGTENQLWTCVPDPAAKGYYFIRNKLSGNVIDIQGASTKPGALLDAYPQKTSKNDNQRWMPVGGEFPPPVKLPTTLTFANLGTGPEPNTVSSGSTECNYTVNLTIQQDGNCRFWGNYTNRGDVPIITAPAQSFGVAIVVHDMNGKGYSFGYGASNVPSAPQPGGLVTWDKTQKSQAIADNWGSIASRAQASYSYHNDASLIAFLQEIASAIESAVSEIGTAVSDVETVMALASA
jgi:Ricin-type beta-trefoil lectin domain-like